MFCTRCGNQLPTDARFCVRCGTSIGASKPAPPAQPRPSPTPPAVRQPARQRGPVPLQKQRQPPARKSSSWLGLFGCCAGSVLIFGACILVGVYFWADSDWFSEEPGSYATTQDGGDGFSFNRPTGPNGPSHVKPPLTSTAFIRPDQVLTHRSGARLEVPGGPVLYSDKVELREVSAPPVLERCQRLAPVLRFDSYAGEVIDGKTEVDLPAGTGGKDAVVLVWSRLGFWLPLPSQPVTLADGAAGRRVSIDRQPTPWVFTVVSQGQAPRASAGAKLGLVRLEQLNWTDKEALERELARPSASANSSDWSFFPVAYAANVEKPLRGAIECLYRARAAGRRGMQARAWEHYVAGLHHLRTLRPMSCKDELIDLEEDGILWPKGLPTSMDVPVVIETLCANFAPWGLDLMLRMIEGDGDLLKKGFDLRVLPCVGEMMFTDISIAKRSPTIALRGPWDQALDGIVRERNLVPKDTLKTVTLRFYSPRVVEADYFEKALQFTKDYVLRWGPVILALSSTNPATATIPLAFAAIDLIWDWQQREFPPSTVEYATVELSQRGASTIVGAVGIIEEGDLLKFFGKEFPVGSLKKVNTTALFLDWAVTMALIHRKFNPGKIRALATGPLGYKQGPDGYVFSADQFNLPPIMVIGWVEGPYQRQAAYPRYPVGGKFNRSWRLNYESIYMGVDLHDQIEGGLGEVFPPELKMLNNQKRNVGKFPWARYLVELDEDFFPSAANVRFGPQEQAIAFELGKDLLSMIATNRKLQATWDRVNTADLKLEVLLEAPGREPSVLRLPLQEKAGTRASRDHRRFVVRLAMEDHDPTVPDFCPPAMAVPEAGELPELLTKYTLKVVDRQGAGQQVWYTADVDFHSRQAVSTKLQRDSQDWWGDNVEQVSWHYMELPRAYAPRYILGNVYMEMPYQYRVTGSVVESSQPQQGRPYELSDSQDKPLSWQGRTFPIVFKKGNVTETVRVTMNQDDTQVASLEFSQTSPQQGESVRFVLQNIPLRYKGRLGKTDAEFVIFAYKDAELRKNIASCKSKVTRTVTETHPQTRKPVQSTVTSEVTALGMPPKQGGACYVAVMMANKTFEELKAMVQSKQLSEADAEKEFEKMRAVLSDWRGR